MHIFMDTYAHLYVCAIVDTHVPVPCTHVSVPCTHVSIVSRIDGDGTTYTSFVQCNLLKRKGCMHSHCYCWDNRVIGEL